MGAACLTAQTISDFGGLEAVVLSGNEHFSDAKLIAELKSDAPLYLQNIPDAPAGNFYKLVADRLKAGYLACGFPDVKGEMTVEWQQVLIHLDEGPRIFNGDVSFSNVENLPDTLDLKWLEAQIRHGLPYNKKETRWSTANNGKNEFGTKDLFIAGDPTNFSPSREMDLIELIEQILLERGLQAETIETELLRVGNQANLVVRFPGGIFPVTIEAFEIRGIADEASLEEFVREIVESYRERAASSATLNELEAKLLSTFQFSYCEVAFEAIAGSQSELTAVVQLVPWLQAPVIDAPTNEEAYAMRAAVDLRELVENGAELTASLSLLREDESTIESLSFGRDAQRFAFRAQQSLPSGDLSAPQLFLIDQSQVEAWMNSPALDFYFEIRVDGLPVLTNERQFNFTLGFGFTTGRAASLEEDCTLQISPVALAHKILADETDIQFTETMNEDGSVMASWMHADGKVEARFDAAAGRLDHIRFFKQKDGVTRMFAIERKADWIDAIETQTDFNALASVISTAAFIMLDDETKAELAALFGRSDESEQVRESMNLYLGAMLKVVSSIPKDGELGEGQEDVFWIPIDPSQGGGIKMLQFGLKIHQTLADKLQGSSLQHYPLDFGNIAFRRPFAVAPELIRRSESGDLGPLVLALYASTLDYYNQPYVELVAEMALKRMNDDAIHRELSEFVNTAKETLQAYATHSDVEIDNASSEPTEVLSNLNTELLTNWLAADQRKNRLIAYLEKLTINPGTAATPGYSELAAHHYRQAIELGYESAAIRLGHMYQSGQGVPMDEARARELFSDPATAGNPWALSSLGYLWEMGRGGEKDVSIAAEYYRKAAEGGNAQAQCNLGLFYQYGKGVEQDQAMANLWFEKAAAQDHARAQMKLGYNYMKGRGFAQDDVKAAELFTASANKGDQYAQLNLGFLYEKGRGVTQDTVRAVELYRKAAEQGNADAQCNLGQLYQDGSGVEQDHTTANLWFEKAAVQAHARAQMKLGYNYMTGLGVAQDDVKAAELFTASAEQGYQYAQSNLGYLYERGRGVTLDTTKAIDLYKKAAKQGNSWSANQLGQLYWKGLGVEADPEAAARYFRNAIDGGNEWAKLNLGWLYEYGLGVPLDFEEALRFYQSTDGEPAWTGKAMIAQMQAQGKGMPKDTEAAFETYQTLLETEESAWLMAYLAQAYAYGIGTPQDTPEAMRLIQASVEGEDCCGFAFMGDFHRDGIGGAQDYEAAVEWYGKAIEDSCEYGYLGMAGLYEKGFGVDADMEAAVKAYQKAASIGSDPATAALQRLVP